MPRPSPALPAPPTRRAAAAPLPPRSMKGIPELQSSLARLMERSFLPGHAVDPADVCISTGGRRGGLLFMLLRCHFFISFHASASPTRLPAAMRLSSVLLHGTGVHRMPEPLAVLSPCPLP